MGIAATSGHRTGLAPRAMLTIAALILLAAGTWFAASWVDTRSDSTCGAVIHPDIWLGDTTPNSCQGVMAIRSTISAASSAARAATILAIALASSAAVLIVNELVRSDGAF
jgi:hypothetical protein